MIRRLSRRRRDDGFSLIESMIALSIASVIFAALASVMISSLTAAVTGRQAQQASDVLQKAMEGMRAAGYDALALRPSDLSTNEPLPLSGCSCYDPVNNNTTGVSREPLALDVAGTVSPHVSYVTVNATRYTLRQYVTMPVDATGAVFKRITVVGSWSAHGLSHSRSLSSFVVLSRSGLPLPDYKLSLNTSATKCAAPGSTLVYGFTLKNNGARDSFSLTSVGASGLNWNYYLDDDASSVGAYSPSDTAVPTSGGVATIGTIDTNTSRNYWAVANVSSGYVPGLATVTFRATSVSDPVYYQELPTTSTIANTCTSTASPSPSATPSGTPAVGPPQPTTTCTDALPSVSTSGGSTPTTYYLKNASSNVGDTTASTSLPVGKLSPPTSTTLWDYSTDLASNTAGRYVATAGSSTATTAEWRYQFASSTKLTGTGVLDLWAAPASGTATDAVVLTLVVRQLNSTGTLLRTFSATTYGGGSWGCSGPKHVGVSVPFGSGSGSSFAANDLISVQVSSSGAAALLAYDTTTFQSALTLPVKSGG